MESDPEFKKMVEGGGNDSQMIIESLGSYFSDLEETQTFNIKDLIQGQSS